MKIIFLDVDDVLNKKGTATVPYGVHRVEYRGIEPGKVELVNRIMDGAGGPDEVKFVLSSSWRFYHTNPEMQIILNEHGFRGELIDRTPEKMSYISRESEIALWLDIESAEERARPLPEYFLILDDEECRRFQDHHVRPRVNVGLEEKHVKRAVKILKAPAQPLYDRIRKKAIKDEAAEEAYLDRIGKRRKGLFEAFRGYEGTVLVTATPPEPKK